MTTKGENHCIAMHFIIYTRAYRYRLLVMIITEHPAYPYLATDVATCRDGDVSRVSLKYDAAECSPGLLSMEWYPSLFLDAAKCSPRLVTPSCSWSFPPVGFNMQGHVFFRDMWHHPYISSCFCGKRLIS